MVRLIASAAFALLLFGAVDSRSVVRQIAPGVYVRMGDRDKKQPANTGWVVFKDYVLVIDANYPWGAKDIIPEIRKTTNKPIRWVFNTHYHGDHAYGSQLFADEGASILCSRLCAEESESKGRKSWESDKGAGEFSLKPYKLAQPTTTFEDKMSFDDGEHRVEMTMAGPGHTKGDAVAYLPREKILFTGDLCVNWAFGNNVADPDADHANWQRALEAMANWKPKTVVPGHGEIGGVPQLVAQRAYLHDMLDGVTAGIKAGRSADQIAASLDLTKHPIGADKERNAASVKAVYKRLTGK